MFKVYRNENRIEMHRGDTGEFSIRATGKTFGSGDRCLLTIRAANKQIVKKEIMTMTDGVITVTFGNDDTNGWSGDYTIEVRYVVNPTTVTDSETQEVSITNGDWVRTPDVTFKLKVKDVQGEI